MVSSSRRRGAKTFGQQAHDKLARDFRCNVYDKPGYLSGGRPDCVVVNGKNDCWVYEFKPKDISLRLPILQPVRVSLSVP